MTVHSGPLSILLSLCKGGNSSRLLPFQKLSCMNGKLLPLCYPD